jgi:hypothetical protein
MVYIILTKGDVIIVRVFLEQSARQMELLGATTGPDWNSCANRGTGRRYRVKLSSITGIDKDAND